MHTVTDPTQLGNAMLVWLGFVAALFVATQMPMEKFVKPVILHPLRDMKRGAWLTKYYPAICQLAVLLVTAGLAWPLRYQLDILTNVFAYTDFHPFVGALPAVFLAAFAGQQINDKFGKTKPNA